MKVGVKGVVVKDGRVLLIKRSNYDCHRAGEWDLPGGRLEENELPFAGHMREVMEETGLKIDIIEPVRTWHVERLGIEHAGITLLNKYISGEVCLSREHTDYKWIHPEDVGDLDEVPEWLVQDVQMAVELNPQLFDKV